MNLSEQLFGATFARAKIEQMLEPFIDDTIDWDLGWDYYDLSIELHNMPVGWKIPTEIVKTLFDEGFRRMWVNYEDGSEIYYSVDNLEGCKQK